MAETLDERGFRKITSVPVTLLVYEEVVKLGELTVGQMFVEAGDKEFRVWAIEDDPKTHTDIHCHTGSCAMMLHYMTPVQRVKVIYKAPEKKGVSQ